MTEATKEHPAPLDAFESAKPDEPIFTLQGGDPLAAPLVRLWAYMARVRAGTARFEQGHIARRESQLYGAARSHTTVHDEAASTGLLIRATAAEEISWIMDEYLKGNTLSVTAEVAKNDTPEELARIDLHDYRVRAAQRISNMIAEITEITEELRRRRFGFSGAVLDHIASRLQHVHSEIEPRRIMQEHIG